MKEFSPLQHLIIFILSVITLFSGIWACLPPIEQIVSKNASSDAIQVVTFELAEACTPIPLTPTPSATSAALPMPTPTPALTEAPALAEEKEEEAFFKLQICGETVCIAPNVEESTLKNTPGWLTTSAMPGDSGMCVVYGHRNRDHLKVLKNVELGDPITAVLQDGSQHTYTVVDIQIHEKTETLRLPAIDGDSIVLVTCYPFRYTGHAPGKYVVVGRMR